MARDRTKADGPRGRNDAYTMMLFITLLAIGIGCTMLYLDYDEYGKQPPPKEAAPTLPKLGGDDSKGGTSSRRAEPPFARPVVAGRLMAPGESVALLPVAAHAPIDKSEAR